jgi:hypothetical protein
MALIIAPMAKPIATMISAVPVKVIENPEASDLIETSKGLKGIREVTINNTKKTTNRDMSK